MNNRKTIILLTWLFLALASNSFAQKIFYADGFEDWQTQTYPENATINYTVFLIGDVKYPSTDPTMINLLGHYLESSTKASSVVFLGDIVYPKGLPDEDEKGYDEAVSDLNAILEKLRDYKGEIVFTSGNHDWEQGRNEGWNRVLNEEKFIESGLNDKNVYLPDDGCPGPVEVELTDELVIILLNSQWFFQNYRKPGIEDGCEFEDEAGIFIAVEDAIRRHQGKNILFATHHPLISAGNHGGYFPASRMLFPLLDENKNLYILYFQFGKKGTTTHIRFTQNRHNPKRST